MPALFTVTLNDDGLVHANCFEVMEQVNNREACGIFEQNVWLRALHQILPLEKPPKQSISVVDLCMESELDVGICALTRRWVRRRSRAHVPVMGGWRGAG